MSTWSISLNHEVAHNGNGSGCGSQEGGGVPEIDAPGRNAFQRIRASLFCLKVLYASLRFNCAYDSEHIEQV